jgi:hypothetical protein
MLEKLGNLLQGKKTYIIAILIGLGAVAQSLGYIIPEYVYAILGALGLGAVRSGVTKSGS